LQLQTRLRPAQQGLDKLDRKWYSVNNGGECACAGKASPFIPGTRPKMPKSGLTAPGSSKTPPGHVSSLLVAPRPISGASRLPVPACWPTLETRATASPGQLEQLPGPGATHLAHLAAPGAASPGPQPGPPGTRCHTADTSRPLDSRPTTGASTRATACHLTDSPGSGIIAEEKRRRARGYGLWPISYTPTAELAGT
jgi:hypothetical protein